MTYGDHHHSAYKAATYREESKTQQVVMLYEGAIRFVKQAKEAMENGNIEDRYNSITKACEIINGLQLSLNFERGGDISQLLYDYYAGLDQRLNHLHFNKDMAICDLCIRHLTMMKEAWDEVHQKSEKTQGSSNGGDAVILEKLKGLTDSDTPAKKTSTDISSRSSYIALPSELAGINVSA